MSARILVVTAGYPKSPTDGNYTFVGDHCKALQELGAHVEVLAYDSDTESDAPPVPTGTIRVHRLPRYTLKRYTKDVVSGRARLPGSIDFGRFTHVSTQTEVGLPVLRAAKRATAGAVRTSVVMQGRPGLGLREKYWVQLLRRNRSFVDQVFIVGPKMHPVAQRYYGMSATLLPNGARLLTPGPVGDDFASVLTRLEDSEVLSVTTVAILIFRKGIDILLNAVAQVQQTHPDQLFLLLIGEGPDGQTFRDTARELGLENVVHFTGRVDRNRVAAALTRTDVFVLASRVEAYGVAATEAALASCCVLVSDEVDARPAVDPSGHWLVHANGSAEELARDLRWCLDNRESVRQRGEKARSDALTYGSWQRNAEQFLAAIDR